MNAENLRTLAHELRADPTSYCQFAYRLQTPCGSVSCIAGHAQVMGTGRYQIGSVEDDAAKWLGLRRSQRRLFSGFPETDWPRAYAKRFRRAHASDSGESTALVAADLLDALADGTVSL